MHTHNLKLFIWPAKANDILQNLIIRAIRKLDPKIDEAIH